MQKLTLEKMALSFAVGLTLVAYTVPAQAQGEGEKSDRSSWTQSSKQDSSMNAQSESSNKNSEIEGQNSLSSVVASGSPATFFNPSMIGMPTNTISSIAGSQPASFSEFKNVFYKFAPHAQKEDLLPVHSNQQGSGAAPTFSAPPLPGTTPSGLAPSVTEPTSAAQARQYTQGQPVPHPFMQKELTIDTNPLKTHWGPPVPGDIPYMHIMPTNQNPSGMNSQSFGSMPFLTGGANSDLSAHLSALSAAQKTGQKLLNPNLQSIQAAYQGGAQQTADSFGQDVDAAFRANLGGTSDPLINVANENVSSPAKAGQAHRSLAQAIWIVQQMYKRFFMPVALLLLLVGTVATQSTNQIRFGFIDLTALKFAGAQPFEGMIRSLVALFMICGIQLAVSYSIDIGNALTDPIKNMVDRQTLVNWTQGFSNPTSKMSPAQAQKFAQNESTAASTGRVIFSTVQALLNTGLMVLSVYQLVMVCYLYLFGPIAAALYAWPAIGTRFRLVFGNWINGLTNLVLWRFWWSIILLCMVTRIRWLQDMHAYNPNSPWEPIVFTAFMVMLTYVPFAALDFKPGDMVQALLDKATPSKSK